MGSFSWNPPRRMSVGSYAIVTARIGKVPATAGMEGSGATITQPTRISSWMLATLTSDDDGALHVEQIEPAKGAEQLQFTVGVAGHEYAEWKWILTAHRSGTWRLRLLGYVRLQGQNIPVKELPWTTNVPPAVVNVEDPGGVVGWFFSNYWQWMVATLLTILGLAAAFVGLRNKGKTPPPPAVPPKRHRESSPPKTPRRPRQTREETI
jgi:hypothetical protein